MKTFLAWCVHLYTAMGLVAAAAMAVLIVRGGDEAFRWVFVLMVAATLIDATDGYFARKVNVAVRTPGFDGRRLDDLIDFNTYTTLPLLLIWRAGILPAGWSWILLLPLLASAYGFSQVEAKTADDYFLGFPSYWNIIAFYLYVLRFPAWLAAATLVVFAILTFVPLRYLYPTKGSRMGVVTNWLGAFWVVSLVAIVVLWNEAPRLLVWGSVAFPAYYLIASWADQPRGARVISRPEHPPEPSDPRRWAG
jgi:phosphatidylcholine synthase